MSEASYSKSALIIVDMQNDFVHPEGGIAFRAAENPDAGIDIPFIQGTIPHVKQLAGAFRAAGRPVVYVTHVVRADRSDAHYPYWRLPRLSGNRTFIAEGSWGANRGGTQTSRGRACDRQAGLRRLCEYHARYDLAQFGGDDLRCRGGYDGCLCFVDRKGGSSLTIT